MHQTQLFLLCINSSMTKSIIRWNFCVWAKRKAIEGSFVCLSSVCQRIISQADHAETFFGCQRKSLFSSYSLIFFEHYWPSIFVSGLFLYSTFISIRLCAVETINTTQIWISWTKKIFYSMSLQQKVTFSKHQSKKSTGLTKSRPEKRK